MLISRLGSYNDDKVPLYSQGFASASAIRKLLYEENSLWQEQIPDAVRLLIHEKFQQGYLPMQNHCFDQILLALLRRSTPEQLADILEMNEGLENRLYSAAHQVNTLDELCAAVKSKRYTYTRIQRTCIHLLLNMTQQQQWQEPQYLRVLGFTAQGQKILKELKKTAANGSSSQSKADKCWTLTAAPPICIIWAIHCPPCAKAIRICCKCRCRSKNRNLHI